MPTNVAIIVDGKRLIVDADMSLAVALMQCDTARFRTSASGEPRGPLCGMGICFDCRVTVGEERHVRACLARVVEGMEVRTGG